MLLYKMTETGLSHLSEGLANQDRLKVASANDVVILAMADGMGGETLGEQAAEIACNAAFATTCSSIVFGDAAFLDTALPAIQAGFAGAFNALQKAALDHRWNLADLGTTLMVAVYDAKLGDLFYGYVGDGGFAVNQAGECYLVEQPQKGDNANQTHMVLDYDCWRFDHIEKVQSFYVATDGIGDCIAAYDQVHGINDVSFEGEKLLAYPVGWTQDQVTERMDGIFSAPRPVLAPSLPEIPAVNAPMAQVAAPANPSVRTSQAFPTASQQPYAKRYTQPYAQYSKPAPNADEDAVPDAVTKRMETPQRQGMPNANRKTVNIPIVFEEPCVQPVLSTDNVDADPLPGLFDNVDDDRTVVVVWSDSPEVRHEWPFFEQAPFAKVNPAVTRRPPRFHMNPIACIRHWLQAS